MRSGVAVAAACAAAAQVRTDGGTRTLAGTAGACQHFGRKTFTVSGMMEG
jgi:hypothetical protein